MFLHYGRFICRICGLMSVVSVWTNSKPRVEVRTLSQSLGEAGRRLSDIVLLPSQADLLAQQTLLRVWLTGPMGSGKTLMLQLKGRQWVREGRRVVVINARTAARGLPTGHVLEEGIRQAGEGHPGAGSVDRCDVSSDEFNADVLHKELAERGPVDKLCFVVDEIHSGMSVMGEKLAARYPDRPVWCVASFVTAVPKNFPVYRLQAVLRNPPSVQLMLKELDLNPTHKDAYTTRSAARGLPSDGPPVIFIEHSKHNSGVRHLDCLQCANELADIFETKLGLQLRPPTASETAASDSAPTTPSQSTVGQSKRSRISVEATPLSFRDVIILSSMPCSSYRHISGYHWEPAVDKLLQYMIYMGSCGFMKGLKERGVPVKAVVDNTMKEIAFPPKDEVIITDVLGAHSLERKVVVFLRTGGPLSQAELSEHLSRYQAIRSAKGALHKADPETGQEAGTLSTEMLLSVLPSLMYENRDMMYPQLPASVLNSPDHAKMIIHNLFGNMMVARTQSFVEGKEHNEQRHRGEDGEAALTKLRVGSEVRGVVLMPSTESGDTRSSGNQPGSSRSNVVEADSAFLVPDLQGSALGRESEVRRVQRALGVMSEDDKDWELLAASRCLSQYISILP